MSKRDRRPTSGLKRIFGPARLARSAFALEIMGEDERSEHVKTVYAHFGLPTISHSALNMALSMRSTLYPNQAKTLFLRMNGA